MALSLRPVYALKPFRFNLADCGGGGGVSIVLCKKCLLTLCCYDELNCSYSKVGYLNIDTHCMLTALTPVPERLNRCYTV